MLKQGSIDKSGQSDKQKYKKSSQYCIPGFFGMLECVRQNPVCQVHNRIPAKQTGDFFRVVTLCDGLIQYFCFHFLCDSLTVSGRFSKKRAAAISRVVKLSQRILRRVQNEGQATALVYLFHQVPRQSETVSAA